MSLTGGLAGEGGEGGDGSTDGTDGDYDSAGGGDGGALSFGAAHPVFRGVVSHGRQWAARIAHRCKRAVGMLEHRPQAQESRWHVRAVGGAHRIHVPSARCSFFAPSTDPPPAAVCRGEVHKLGAFDEPERAARAFDRAAVQVSVL